MSLPRRTFGTNTKTTYWTIICHYQTGLTPLMSLPRRLISTYTKTTDLILICRYQTGLNPLVSLPRRLISTYTNLCYQTGLTPPVSLPRRLFSTSTKTTYLTINCRFETGLIPPVSLPRRQFDTTVIHRQQTIYFLLIVLRNPAWFFNCSGGFLIQLTLGSFYSFGNMMTYLTSYMRYIPAQCPPNFI